MQESLMYIMYDENYWATGVKFDTKKEFKHDCIFCRNIFRPIYTSMAIFS
jgi:regulator of replication initiation timing